MKAVTQLTLIATTKRGLLEVYTMWQTRLVSVPSTEIKIGIDEEENLL